MSDEKDLGESATESKGKAQGSAANKASPKPAKDPKDVLLAGPKGRTIVLVPEDLNEKRTAVEGLQELLAAHRSLRRNLRSFCNQWQAGSFLPQIYNFAYSHELLFGYRIAHIDPVRISGNALDIRLHFDVQISAVKVRGGNTVAIFG